MAWPRKSAPSSLGWKALSSSPQRWTDGVSRSIPPLPVTECGKPLCPLRLPSSTQRHWKVKYISKGNPISTSSLAGQYFYLMGLRLPCHKERQWGNWISPSRAISHVPDGESSLSLRFNAPPLPRGTRWLCLE